MTPSTLLESWQHRCWHDSSSVVVPDGCRDLIALERAGQATRWFVSPLADTSYRVESPAGTRFTGYRLRPGAQLDEGALLNQLCAIEPADVPGTLTLIDSFTRLDRDTEDALLALAWGSSVAGAARSLGVGERHLERLLQRRTGRTPVFWRQLARIRRAALALGTGGRRDALAELAVDQGFSDQAHMTREFQRWLGVTPALMQAQTTWCQLMAQSGYGVPVTGVQSSTRNPSRSAT